jgi:hypothetical protein
MLLHPWAARSRGDQYAEEEKRQSQGDVLMLPVLPQHFSSPFTTI